MFPVYSFTLKSMFAHFRKPETNSTSLSYFFPPPTVIQGIIAGLLGIERNTYYSELDEANLLLSAAILEPPKKITTTTNYVHITDNFNSIKFDKHTQIPLEFVVSREFPKKPIAFKIFVHPKNESLNEKLRELFSQKKQLYPTFAGAAFCPSWLEDWEVLESPEELQSSEPLEINTLIPLHAVDPESIELRENSFLMRERTVRSFDDTRMRKSFTSLLWEKNGNPIRVKPNENTLTFEYIQEQKRRRGLLF